MVTVQELWVYVIFWSITATYMYKMNKAVEVMSMILIGGSGAEALVYAVNNLNTLVYIPMAVQGKWWIIIPTIIGALLLSRFTPRYGFMQRYPTSLMASVSIGLMVGAIFRGQIYSQITSTVSGLAAANGAVNIMNQVVILIGAVFTLWYFVYTVKQRGALGYVARIARWFMLASFGTYWAGELLWYWVNGVQQPLLAWLHVVQNLFGQWQPAYFIAYLLR